MSFKTSLDQNWIYENAYAKPMKTFCDAIAITPSPGGFTKTELYQGPVSKFPPYALQTFIPKKSKMRKKR